MSFVNPLEILNIAHFDISAINSDLIKKEKRKLFAEIELSDEGIIEYNGLSLNKSDCEHAVDQLEYKDRIEYYHFLANNNLLNNFLINGDMLFFESFKQESIYKLTDFLNFIQPYFTPQFDKALKNAFLEKNENQLDVILKTSFLISPSKINEAFKSVDLELSNRIKSLDKITSKIKDESTEYTNDSIDEVLSIVEDFFPVKLLNKLPVYFQSQINKIATAINQLQIIIWNEFNTTIVSLRLLEHLLALNLESVSKPVFQNNYEIVRKAHEEKIEQKRNAPILQKWASALVEIQAKIKRTENNEIESKSVFGDVFNLISVQELNALPSFANEIRTQIGLSLRSLSIACWNCQNDIKSALALINLALQIDVVEDVKHKFIQDQKELLELEKKYQGVLVCHFCDKNSPDDNCSISKTIYKETGRSYFPQRSVQFSYSEVAIPRCKSCKEVHAKGNEQFILYLIGLLILGGIIGAVTEGEHFIIGGLIGGFLGFLIGKAVEGNKIKETGIKDATDSTLSGHPLLSERMRTGWSFNKPTA
jgi:hypothetical protein